ncbi:hypothetical protein [Defluviimonas sp. WL0075]|uniref:Uncharacterized protein n=1 Tax=Albidovulum sediminicola TaxID=2984331 RepID=A0ABT2Z2L8_9RHOB|nr:hypothetical protein [Defluviimonas sp. WL0075]MCV2865021.1 hypothetical protein [Defluviimonas sp. WL0075]
MFAAITSLITAVVAVAPIIFDDDFTVISECSPVTPESRVIGGAGGLAGAGSLYIEGTCRLINAERFDIGVIDITTIPIWYSGNDNPRTVDDTRRHQIANNADFFDNPPILNALSAMEIHVIFEVDHSARFSWLAVGIGKYAASLSDAGPLKLNDLYLSALKSDMECYREGMPIERAIREVFEGEPGYSLVSIRLANDQRIEIYPNFEGFFDSNGLPMVGTPACPELSEYYLDADN